MVRRIEAKKITNATTELCVKANLVLRKDVLSALKKAYKLENNKRARRILDAIIQNADIARKERLAICQDTGLPVVFVEIGQDVVIKGDLKSAINKGIYSGYREASLRNSIVKDPLKRGKSGFGPTVIHTDIAKGSKIKLTVLPKGFGCENKTQLKMFKPTVDLSEVKSFVIDVVRAAGPDACPPYVVGIGIGGTADYACWLAKKALLRKIKNQKSNIKNTAQKSKISISEKDLLEKINKLNIGPMGLGGKTTALAVNIETHPTHIAGLPVAVNISCHALRSASKTL